MAKISTLTDNFNDNSRDPVLWGSFGTLIEESNGELRWTSPTTTPSYAGYYSRSRYDLTDSEVYVKITEVSANASSITTLQIFAVEVSLDNNNQYSWLIEGGTIKAIQDLAGVRTELATAAFHIAIYTWVKIREAGGTVYFEYSSDGLTWAQFTTDSTAFAVTSVEVEMTVGTYGAETLVASVAIDNFNVAAAPVGTGSDEVAIIESGAAGEATRQVKQSVQVSWKKDFSSGIAAFTIGTSLIGGNDFIGSPNSSVTSAWNKYKYFNESDYVTALGVERELNLPLGGVAKALADVSLSNTSGRFLPFYMGGDSELHTAILPRRPIIVQAGFNEDGIDVLYPRFVGLTDNVPEINQRQKRVEVKATDFLDYMGRKFVDDTSMFTAVRSDVQIESVLSALGFSTAQYELDQGINTLQFGILERGSKYIDFIHEVAVAENAHFYQDEDGVFRFENRQHWNTSPHTNVQRIIATSQVIDVETPNDSNLINVVEVRASPREKVSGATLYTLAIPIELSPGDNEFFVDFDNPVLAANTPSRTANTQEDGSGSDVTSQVTLKSSSVFAQAAKYVYTNSTGATAYLTAFTVTGRWAVVADEIYVRKVDQSSVTAYEEHPVLIENDYIADSDWANSYAQLILDTYSEPENLLEMVVRAMPTIRFGDRISWQARDWIVYGIADELDASQGYLQRLKLVKRNAQTYFRIGISTIGGGDAISS